MTRGLLTICAGLVLGSLTVKGQHLEHWLAISKASPAEAQQAVARIDRFVVSLKEPGQGSKRHLAKVFRKVHAEYLKEYEAYADFHAVFDEGKYDCLTATTLFSQVLSDLNYSFKIIETNYHIFILVQTEDGVALLETTDRIGGFVTDPKVLARRTEGYRKNELVNSNVAGDAYRYQYRCNLYQEVSADQLSGLLVFNQSVKAYNGGDWLASARLLEEAHSLYATGRCFELGDILVRTLVTRKDVTSEMRRACMEHLLPLIVRASDPVATSGID